MGKNAFEGLSIDPKTGMQHLRRCAEALSGIAVAEGKKAHPRAALALAGLCYFVLEHDVVPDDRPGGLADDLAVMAIILAELDPKAAKGLPLRELKTFWGGMHFPDFKDVKHDLLGVARAGDEKALLEKVRKKLAALD